MSHQTRVRQSPEQTERSLSVGIDYGRVFGSNTTFFARMQLECVEMAISNSVGSPPSRVTTGTQPYHRALWDVRAVPHAACCAA